MKNNNEYTSLFMHIDGEWIGAEGRDTHQVINPASGETIGELPLASESDLDRALRATEKAFTIWKHASAETRSDVLRGAAKLLRERRDDIIRVATLEEGKTLPEARMEVGMSASLFEFYAEETKRLYGRVLVRPDGVQALVTSDPVGPVAAFAPWNFPINNPARKLGGPIAAGCTVILKAAEEAPASAIAVLKCLLDAGLPQGVAQLVFGIPDKVSTYLLASPIIRKLSFTGSVPVGKHLMALAAMTMKRTTMELGGHAPVLIFEDADIEDAVTKLTASKFRNAGQVCISPTRFYVQEKIFDRFKGALLERIEKITVGDGLDPDTVMGPMANARRLDAIDALVMDAVKQGGERLTGGINDRDKGYFYNPTLLVNVPEKARIMNEEPFGPVIICNPFKTYDEAIEKANRLPFGLAAYAFTSNVKTATLVGRALEAGMVGINTTAVGGADSPFGGVKESGHGAEDGPEGIAACRVTKVIHQG